MFLKRSRNSHTILAFISAYYDDMLVTGNYTLSVKSRGVL